MKHKGMTAKLATTLLGIGILLMACTSADKGTTQSGAAPSSKSSPVADKGWEQKWNSTLAQAKEEGTVNVYTHWLPATRTALGQAFKDKYGINVEFSTFTSGSDLMARVQAENRAGIYAADVFGMGVSPLLNNMKPEGLLGPVQPLLILPDVANPKAWFSGKLPLPDKEGMAFGMVGMVMHMVVFNTDMIKTGEITTYRDLLKPQYKGKITMHDPSISGSANAAVTNIGHYLWGEAETKDFLRKLLKDQGTVVQRDYRLHLESVARGKYAIGLAPTADLMAEFLNLGAPIKMAIVDEDTIYTSSAGAVGVPAKIAHPNAAAVFVNWLLTKEGQAIIVKTMGNPSTRLDAPTEGVSPLFIPDPNKKYYNGDTEESLAAKTEWRNIAKSIMDEVLR